MIEPASTVLFLCTGNYYRSRFAEAYFNFHAPGRKLDWKAVSRGFRFGPNNVGPVSAYTAARLKMRGIPLDTPLRGPQIASERDLKACDLIVAVKEAEHRGLMCERFPAWVDRVEYWQIHDLDFAQPADALAELEAQLEKLLARMAAC